MVGKCQFVSKFTAWLGVIVMCWICCLTVHQSLFSDVLRCGCLTAQRVLFDDVLARTEPVYVFCSPCRDLIIETSTPAVDLPAAEEKSLFARILRYTAIDSSGVCKLGMIANSTVTVWIVVCLSWYTGVKQSTIQNGNCKKTFLFVINWPQCTVATCLFLP